jgi:hypothetical protein
MNKNTKNSKNFLLNIKLLLPAIFPSWRFFDTCAPSPRIEFILLETIKKKSSCWKELYPKPFKLSFSKMLIHIFWNPRWNEYLFLIYCVEKFITNPTEKNKEKILYLIKIELGRNSINFTDTPYYQFRLIFLFRDDTKLEKQILFKSKVYKYY